MWYFLKHALIVFVVVAIYYLKARNKVGKDVPFVPIESDISKRVFALAKLQKDEKFIDLGCGDGRMVIAAAMQGAVATGYELDRLKVWYAKFWIKILRLHNAKVIRGDLYKANLKDADVVYTYLLQEVNDEIEDKLMKELKKGSRVVSLAFEFNKMKLIAKDLKGCIYGPIYLYEV